MTNEAGLSMETDPLLAANREIARLRSLLTDIFDHDGGYYECAMVPVELSTYRAIKQELENTK